MGLCQSIDKKENTIVENNNIKIKTHNQSKVNNFLDKNNINIDKNIINIDNNLVERKNNNKKKLEKKQIKNVNKTDSDEKYRKKSIPKSLKKQVWDHWIGKDIGTAKCLCCNHSEIRQIEFHCGHIIAEKDGGKTVVSNLKPVCAQCNLSMGTMNMEHFHLRYFKD